MTRQRFFVPWEVFWLGAPDDYSLRLLARYQKGVVAPFATEVGLA